MVAALMDESFSKFGRATNNGEKLLAAVIWKLPQFARPAGGRMVRSRQALKSWSQVLPPGGRFPVPMAVVARLAMVLL